jgi:hypothetical protein
MVIASLDGERDDLAVHWTAEMEKGSLGVSNEIRARLAALVKQQ